MTSRLSELDQAIAEHAYVAQELQSQSSRRTTIVLQNLRNELQRQVDENGQDGQDRVDMLRIEEIIRGIQLPNWVPVSIAKAVSLRKGTNFISNSTAIATDNAAAWTFKQLICSQDWITKRSDDCRLHQFPGHFKKGSSDCS